jgi:hypothetical protein
MRRWQEIAGAPVPALDARARTATPALRAVTADCWSASNKATPPGIIRTGTVTIKSFSRCVQCASGSGRSWKCTTMGLRPFPPSLSHGARSPLVVHNPLPFQPAFGSSMRPSKPLA